jgi:hypothetical protein
MRASLLLLCWLGLLCYAIASRPIYVDEVDNWQDDEFDEAEFNDW